MDFFFKYAGKIAKAIYGSQDDNISLKKYVYFFFYQKILRFNAHVPWPVHYTSMVNDVGKITFGPNCSPGSAPFQYIQGANGIKFGKNIWLAPGVQIISRNHNFSDYSKYEICRPVEIGDNVWVGSNTVILPGIHIGDNVIIGAGSVVTKDISANSVAVGNPCKIIKSKPPYQGE